VSVIAVSDEFAATRELNKSPTNQPNGFDFLSLGSTLGDSSEIGLEPRLLAGRQLDTWTAAKDYRL
jgi:hypothetical protein